MWVFIDPSMDIIECREDCPYTDLVALLGKGRCSIFKIDQVTPEFSVIYNPASDSAQNVVIAGVEKELCGGPYEGPAKHGPVAVVGSSATLWDDYLPLTVESAATISQFAQDV
jgi:hypothetical protein